MKKILYFGIIVICVFALWGTLTSPVSAQTTQPTATPTAVAPTTVVSTPTLKPTLAPTPFTPPDPADIYLFNNFGFNETTLRGPYGAVMVLFGIPANWKLTENSAIHLKFMIFLTKPAPVQTKEDIFGGVIDVNLNGITIGTILLDHTGEYDIYVPISERALIPIRADGRHRLLINLISEECHYDFNLFAVIHETSEIILPHIMVTPPINLGDVPHPLFQAGSVSPEYTTLVIPDKPSAAEMQAALLVSAGFGLYSNGDMNLEIVPSSQLTNEIKKGQHIIFVGKPGAFPMFSEIKLPSPAGGSGFQVEGSEADDGILQLAISPWNEFQAILVVSGNTDAAVIKAAQAVGIGAIPSAKRVDLALVKFVNPAELPNYINADRTLSDLGYENKTVTNIGLNTFEYIFSIPPGQLVGTDAYFELHFDHSALLAYDRSGMVIKVNDETIGSTRYTEESTRITSIQMSLPNTIVKPGKNILRIEVDHTPIDVCTDFLNWASLWTTVFADSYFHLNLQPQQIQAAAIFPQQISLNMYPRFMEYAHTMGNIVVVLPPDDQASWAAAAKILFDLGDKVNDPFTRVTVLFADNITDDIMMKNHVIVIGRATKLPFLYGFKDKLPLPFQEGTDIIDDSVLQVGYRFTTDASLGYIELLPSPWNETNIMIGVFGKDDLGLQYAANALTLSDIRLKLMGNFAVINGNQVNAGDTRILSGVISGTPNPTGQPIANNYLSQISNQPMPSTSVINKWIVPAVGVSSLAMILIVVILAISALRRRK